MSNSNQLYESVESIIKNDIRHLIELDGGRINLVDVRDDIVYVRLGGACKHCAAIQLTLKVTVERILKSKLPQISKVELVR